MHTYCLLKSGKIMVVYSDNINRETMHLYELEELEDYDAESLFTTEVKYSEIDRTDSNLSYLKTI